MEKNSNSKNWSESRPLWLMSTSMTMHYTELVYDSVLTAERGRYSDSSKFVFMSAVIRNLIWDLSISSLSKTKARRTTNQNQRNYCKEDPMSTRGKNKGAARRAYLGFKPMTFAIPVQHSTNWANKPTGSWSIYDFRYMKFIYLHCGEEMKLRDPRS